MGWMCKNCGPVNGFIPGKKGEPHCVNMDCDLVLTYERIEPRRTVKHFTSGAVTPSPAAMKKKMPAEERAASAKATREGRAILEAMEARQKARATGRIAPARPPKPAPPKTPRAPKAPVRTVVPQQSEGNVPKSDDAEKSAKTSREGTCEKCGQSKWLLSKTPPLCRSCFGAGRPKGQRKKRKGKEAELAADAIAREVRATDTVTRELTGLSPGAVRRVLRFALDHVAEATNTTPQRLLALDVREEPSPPS